MPKIDELEQLISAETHSLSRRRKETLSKLQQELADHVTDWAEELKERKDRALLASRINTLVTERITSEMRQHIQNFVKNVDVILVQIDENDIGKFSDVEIEYEQVTGRVKKAAASVSGALAGAWIGSFAGPVGIAIGGVIGGLVGDAGGDFLVETEVLREQVGVDATQAIEDTLKKLDRKLPGIIDRAFKPWQQTLDAMKKSSQQLRAEIKDFDNHLDKAKGDL